MTCPVVYLFQNVDMHIYTYTHIHVYTELLNALLMLTTMLAWVKTATYQHELGQDFLLLCTHSVHLEATNIFYIKQITEQLAFVKHKKAQKLQHYEF